MITTGAKEEPNRKDTQSQMITKVFVKRNSIRSSAKGIEKRNATK
jgi:hypothetical protein